jgi:1,4-alpha-glucan branching enzyme
MIFQGEEFLDNADYKHGVTSTWGNDFKWLSFDMNPAKLASIRSASENPELLKGLSNEDRDFVQTYTKMSPEQKTEAEVLANKRGHFNWYRDLIALRNNSEAFTSGSQINRIYSHNADRVMAYERKGGNENYVVVSNFSDQNRHGYKVNLPPGKWQEVVNSDAGIYGGGNVGNGGSIVDGNSGLSLPQGGTLIFKRVG